jgi:acyl-CoA thioesterase II
MGDLGTDTALAPVPGEAGRYTARLSSDWEIWGPNGGYVAAVALRAAGLAGGLASARPASLVCHYLGVAAFDVVDVAVVPLRTASRAESLRVSIGQGGRPVMEAMVWAVADGVDGLEHDWAPPPDDVPPPSAVPTMAERFPDGEPPFRFWHNIEHRPLDWIGVDDWLDRPPGAPVARSWNRFVPTSVFDDPWLDAGRLAIMVDTFTWPAAVRAHTGELPWIAPSLDLAVRFHRPASSSPHLLAVGTAPVAEAGLIGCQVSVWSEAGRLLASGGQQMLCRPAAPPRR